MRRKNRRRQLGLTNDQHLDKVGRILWTVESNVSGAYAALGMKRCDTAISQYGSAEAALAVALAHRESSGGPERYGKRWSTVAAGVNQLLRAVENNCRFTPTTKSSRR